MKYPAGPQKVSCEPGSEPPKNMKPPRNPDWILVQGSNPQTIQKAVLKHTGLICPIVPTKHWVLIFQVDEQHFGLRFEPPIPPYSFTNLIGWLGDPKMTKGAIRAVGWLTSPGNGMRYYLTPPPDETGGDTLLGINDAEQVVEVFLPDCSLRRTYEELVFPPGPPMPGKLKPLVEFEITVDSARSFGNPDFLTC